MLLRCITARRHFADVLPQHILIRSTMGNGSHNIIQNLWISRTTERGPGVLGEPMVLWQLGLRRAVLRQTLASCWVVYSIL